MSIVTLHLRIPRDAPSCAVCGAKFGHSASRWWLHNTWTDATEHFSEGSTHTPGETAIPCGRLVDSSPSCATGETP